MGVHFNRNARIYKSEPPADRTLKYDSGSGDETDFLPSFKMTSDQGMKRIFLSSFKMTADQGMKRILCHPLK
ncbi:MAG: hypothetical protein DRI57_29870 [Deltaproteobacteria bacterium]|nr:MAG: hypothetical protein DRI57_29870 [Deltaproteobacteria bacterium]